MAFDPSLVTMRTRFFASNLQYANDWEDHTVAETALAVRETDDVLTIAGAGCNLLALLLRRPRSILAIDVSESQIELCRLKLEAIKRLTWAEFVALLGLRPGGHKVYQELRQALPVDLRRFWDEHVQSISGGLCESGAYERKHHLLQRELSPSIRRERCEHLFRLAEIPDQIEYFDDVLEPEVLAEPLRLLYSFEAVVASGRVPPMVQRYAHDPNRFSQLYPSMLRRTLSTSPARHNHYLRHLLLGSFGPIDDEHGPMLLRPARFAELKTLVDRVTLVHADLRTFAAPDDSFDKINLSSVLCAFDDVERDRVVDQVSRMLRPGGRWTGTEHELSKPHAAASCGLVACPEDAEHSIRHERFPLYGRRIVEEHP